MGIRVLWDDQGKQVIRYIIAGTWTWPEVYDAVHVSDTWLDEVEHKVHFIIDLRKSDSSIADKSLGNVRRMMNNAHPNTGIIVITGNSNSVVFELARSIVSMAQRIVGRRLFFHYADSLEDARAIIQNEIDLV